MRHTKIIATIGPASNSDAALDALISAGTDIFRLNFSHGTQESQGATFARIRAAAARAGCEVAILQDLAGPKIRTGRLAGGKPIKVKPGDKLVIATGDFVGDQGRLSTTYEGLAHSVRPGNSKRTSRILSSGSITTARAAGRIRSSLTSFVTDSHKARAPPRARGAP